MIKSNGKGYSKLDVVSKKLSTSFFRMSLIVLIAGGLFLVQSRTDAYAQDCSTVPANPIANCGFETGDFTGWVTQDFAVPFFALQVSGAGLSPGFGFFDSDPTQGVFAALNGFDGEGPGTIRIAQDVSLPTGSTELVFDYRCGWSMLGFGATEDRTFEVNIEPSGGGAPLQTDLILTAQAGTQAVPDSGGNLTGIVDVSAFAGGPFRISFDWFVPQNFTGPAFCQLDNVSVTVSATPIPTLSEWGLIAMAGVLGIVGLFAIRRRKLTA
jgi:IPTL-CTERM motif